MASQSGGSRDQDDDDDYDDEIWVPAPTIVLGNATGRYRNSSVTTAAPPAVKEMASTNGGATRMNQSLLGRRWPVPMTTMMISPSPSAKKWIREASKYQSLASKDSDKHPG